MLATVWSLRGLSSLPSGQRQGCGNLSIRAQGNVGEALERCSRLEATAAPIEREGLFVAWSSLFLPR